MFYEGLDERNFKLLFGGAERPPVSDSSEEGDDAGRCFLAKESARILRVGDPEARAPH